MTDRQATSRLWKALAVLVQMHGRGQLDDDVADAYEADLAAYPEAQVLAALDRCRRELRTFPTIADILARIEDGRPGPEEAWAMIPKDEIGSVVWTDEMRDAFGIVRELMAKDPVAARMSFRETYLRLVTEARSAIRPTRWSPSFGMDPELRTQALQAAIHAGRITVGEARALIPNFDQAPEARKLLAGPEAPAPDLDQISGVVDRILDGAPEKMRTLEKIRKHRKPGMTTELPDQEETERLRLEALEKAKQMKGETG